MNKNLTLNISLKAELYIEAAGKFFNDTLQWTCWNATPEHADTLKTYDCLMLIKQKIEEKRTLHRGWHDYEHQRAKIT
jgi:hypothetical protein